MPSKFTKYDNEQMPYTELGPPGRILWLDDLPDRLEAQDQPEEESKIGGGLERSARGKQKDPVYEMKRRLGEQFATAARLYAEAVAVFTGSPLTVSQDEYHRLRKAAEEARTRRSHRDGVRRTRWVASAPWKALPFTPK
jgi:hypothetical protein